MRKDRSAPSVVVGIDGSRSAAIQLLVVAHDRIHGIGELIGLPCCGTLSDGNCSVLICEPQNVL
jgi:hypothetical protein